MRSADYLQAVEVHAGGAPGRVLTNAFLRAPGATMIDRFVYCKEHLEPLRRFLLREPRGYPGMSCNLLVPPVSPGADVGYICLEQGGFTPMSGSNSMCVVTAVLETGMLTSHEGLNRLVLDTPAGVVPATATVENQRVIAVELENVPSFVAQRRVDLDVPTLGTVPVDIAYGGQFYVLASATSLGLVVDVDNSRELARVGVAVLSTARATIEVCHPEYQEINEITWAMIYNEPSGGVARCCVVGPTATGTSTQAVGVLDRSPCGTGLSARLAVLSEDGALREGETYEQENVLGRRFTGRRLGDAKVGTTSAIRTAVSGRAFITGFSSFLLDPEDPFAEGFVLGDIWSVQ